jgi:hypothetical protein
LEADAQMLGISISAAARLRLRTGRVPSVQEVESARTPGAEKGFPVEGRFSH